MSTSERLLYLYSVLLIVALAWNIVHSYLRRTRDLLSATNFFLLGGMVFVGLSSLGSATQGWHYAPYSQNVYLIFMASATWFFAVYILAASFMRRPYRFGGRIFQAWPEPTWSVTLAVLALLVGLAIFDRAIQIPGVSVALRAVSTKGAAFAVALAFAAWWRNRVNIMFLVLLGGAFFAALLISVLGGGGRKAFLSVMLAIPVCYYWIDGRQRTPSRNLVLGAFAGVALIFIVASYSATRWFDLGKEGEERTVATSVDQLSNTVNNVTKVDPFSKISKYGQNATDVSLYCIMRSASEPAAWFESLYLVAVNPIPRSVWPEKPKVLGKAIVEEVKGERFAVNWGPGIVGHGYNEGGLYGGWLMLAFYAVLLASIAQVVDGCLASQPKNPFLIGAFVSVTPNMLALIRGDMTLAFVQMGGGFVLLLIVYAYARLLYGSGAPATQAMAPPRYATR